MTATETKFPSFEYWRHRCLEGDETLWRHLRSMDAGTEGGFSQRIFAAMDKADLNNSQILYQAFPHLFNPKGIGY